MRAAANAASQALRNEFHLYDPNTYPLAPSVHRMARTASELISTVTVALPNARPGPLESRREVSRCQHETPPQAKFCLECVARVALTCTLELLQRVDPLLRSRMGGEKPSPAGALGLQEPGQRVDHHFLGIPGTAEEIDTVAVRVVFLLAAIATGDQGAGDRRETAAAREELVENNDADAHSDAECLRLGDMAEIVVGELMGQDAPELVIAVLQKNSGD